MTVAESKLDNVADILICLQRLSGEKVKQWQKGHATVKELFHSDVSRDSNTRMEINRILFEEKQRLISIVEICSSVRGIKLRCLDVHKAVNSCILRKLQTLDEFVKEEKLENYLTVLQTQNIINVGELLTFDPNKIKQDMKTAPFRRLTKKIEKMRNVTEYVDSQVTIDVTQLQDDYHTCLDKIGETLSGIILRLKCHYETLKCSKTRKQEGYFDMFLQFTGVTEKATYLPETNPRKKQKCSETESRNIPHTRIAESDNDDWVKDIEMDPNVKEWLDIAKDEFNEWSKLFHAIKQMQSDMNEYTGNINTAENNLLVRKMINDTDQIMTEFLTDFDQIEENLIDLTKT